MSLTSIFLRAASYFSRDAANGRVYPTNVADSLIVGSTQFDDAGGTDRDFRLFFNKAKGALRAGRVTGTQWNDASVGTESTALGLNCTASGQASIAAGTGCTASNTGTAAFGQNSVASGQFSTASGNGTTASGSSSLSAGYLGTASGWVSIVSGSGAAASRMAQHAHGGGFRFAANGDAQANKFVASRITSGATPGVLLFDNGQLTANAVTLTTENTNVLTIPVSRAHRFTINAVARRTDTPGTFGGWTITGTIVRSSSGNARFIGVPSVVPDLDAGAATWTLAVAVNTSNATNNYLEITATGEAGATIRWVAEISTAEVG